MLRLLGVWAALAAVGCGSLPRPEPADDGVAVDEGRPPPDDGPLFAEPRLAPTELGRVTPGTRLAVRAYVLPDGTRVERISRRLYDRELDAACGEIDGAFTAGGDLRCLPNTHFVDAFSTSGTFVDGACTMAAFDPRPDGCGPAFLTERVTSADDTFLRVYGPSDTTLRNVFRRDGAVCEATRVSDAWTAAEEYAEDRFVRGDEVRVQVSPELREVTRTYDDGTEVVRRELVEPCQLVEDEDGGVRCVSGVAPFSGSSASAETRSLLYANADCTAPVFPIGLPTWDLLGLLGYSQQHLILYRADRSLAVFPVFGLPGETTGGSPLRVLDDEARCVESAFQPLSVLRLGPEVGLDTFPELTRTESGAGRLRVIRWLDADGVAWPVGEGAAQPQLTGAGRAYGDDDRGEDCVPSQTVEGVRCLPFTRGRVSYVSAITPPGRVPVFRDAACTEGVALAPPGATIGIENTVQRFSGDCPISGSVYLGGRQAIMRAFALGNELPDDFAFHQRLPDGECTPWSAFPSGDFFSYRAIGEDIPLSSFAALPTVPR